MTSGDATSRNPLWKILLPILVIVGVAIGGLYVLKSQLGDPNSAGHDTLGVGDQLPDITFHKLGGGEVKFSELGKKVVLVNFWATWCEACVVEMPSIVALRKSYVDQGFEVAFVSVDENPEAVLPRFLSKLKIGFQTYVDKDQELAEMFDVHAIPLTVILNQNREILFIESGERDWNSEQVRKQVEEWLKG